MKEHFCPVEKSVIAYENECNWCGEKEPLQALHEENKRLGLYKESLGNHIEDNLVMVAKGDTWRKQLTSAQRNELLQIEDGTWEADRNG
jgi:hypothetical protein